MKRPLGILLFCLGALGLYFVAVMVPGAKDRLQAMIPMASSAGADPMAWNAVYAESRKLPPVPPFGKVKRSTRAVRDLVAAVEDLQYLEMPSFGEEIPKAFIDTAFTHLQSVQYNLKILDKQVHGVPLSLVPDEHQAKIDILQQVFTEFRPLNQNLDELKHIIDEHFKNEADVLVWLGNPNETRPMGGFAGSLMMLHFTQSGLAFEFKDTYSLDRLVPARDMLVAPEYLHPVAKKLSLRDVNIESRFSDVAELTRYFMMSTGREAPESVVAINLSLIGEVLKRTGPVKLKPYNVMLDEGNFDMILSFLVESKAAGRYSAKDPVFDFGGALFSPEVLSRVPLSSWLSFDLKTYLSEKNILADSNLSYTNRKIIDWALTSEFMPPSGADDFAQFSFVNVGSNKTDRFTWTRLTDVTEITQEGKAVHSLKIKRTHSLNKGELNGTLRLSSWPQTLRNLFDGQMAWVLGEGENRAWLRLHVPKRAKIIGYNNQSGDMREKLVYDGKIRVYEIPMYVKPGESLDAEITYEVPLSRGSRDWRPYHFHLSPSSHQPKTEFRHSIKTNGAIAEQTANTGKPQRLTASDFRSVINFNLENDEIPAE